MFPGLTKIVSIYRSITNLVPYIGSEEMVRFDTLKLILSSLQLNSFEFEFCLSPSSFRKMWVTLYRINEAWPHCRTLFLELASLFEMDI